MRFFNFIIILLFFSHLSWTQNFIDTTYTITTDNDIYYGSAVNFAGQTIDLHMDISYPTNDIIPDCGRPLILIIHGGAWMIGSKDDGWIPRARRDFAKRGYVAVAINYRLGLFQTHVRRNCNVPDWNCLNIADSTEWVRGLCRGIQDANAAIRYMIINKENYNIDASNVYVIGESAGAFIALGVGYMDDESEKPWECGALSPVNPPHQSYYEPCIRMRQYDIAIDEMDLSRPDLGPVSGTLNPTDEPYFIRGVGAFYGGIFQDLFTTNSSVYTPILYMFHQPNDLVVPIRHNRLLRGLNTCAVQLFGCSGLQNRPMIYGSTGISDLIDTLTIPEENKPQVLFQRTNNNTNCLQQILNPATGGHQLDNFNTRHTALATFFAQNIGEDDCIALTVPNSENFGNFNIFPNPNNGNFTIQLNDRDFSKIQLQIFDLSGKQYLNQNMDIHENQFTVQSNLQAGMYIIQLRLKEQNTIFYDRVIVLENE